MKEDYQRYCAGHRKRLREKFLKNGIKTFTDYEILELILTYSIPRKDTKVIAKKLIAEFGNLETVFKSVDNLKVAGLGENSITLLKLLGELPEVIYENKLKLTDTVRITNKGTLIKYLRALIGFENIERFYVLYLSTSNELISCEEKSYGTIDRSAIYPREIYRNLIKYNAKSIILAHNHPSGNITPSKDDINITQEIAKGLKIFDALLLEHIIITKNSYFSFLEEGLI